MCEVRILVLTGPGLDHEEGNSTKENRDTALGWSPEGRRARERAKATWRTTVERKKNKAGWKTRNVAKAEARNRECLSENVSA